MSEFCDSVPASSLATEHTALPVAVPDLTGLTDEQLASLRAKILSSIRDHRRKANSAIGKIEALRKSSNRMLAMTRATPEAERQEIMANLERELLPYPTIYLEYAIANALVLLDVACREEGLRRSPAGAGRVRRVR